MVHQAPYHDDDDFAADDHDDHDHHDHHDHHDETNTGHACMRMKRRERRCWEQLHSKATIKSMGRALRSRIFASRTGQGVPRAQHWCLGSGAIVSEG